MCLRAGDTQDCVDLPDLDGTDQGNCAERLCPLGMRCRFMRSRRAGIAVAECLKDERREAEEEIRQVEEEEEEERAKVVVGRKMRVPQPNKEEKENDGWDRKMKNLVSSWTLEVKKSHTLQLFVICCYNVVVEGDPQPGEGGGEG